MKNYEVEIFESGQHGQYKASKIFTWILSSDTISKAKDFATDILAGMTFKEVYGENTARYGYKKISLENGECKLHFYKADELLGYEVAEKHFTIKARLLK